MYRIEIGITLTLRGPFITQSSEPGAYGMDSVMARDSDGRFIIPGAHIVGKLRQAWQELRSAIGNEPVDTVPTWDEIDYWLGAELSEGSYQPKTKKLFFTDFVLTGAVPPSGARHRIQIDPDRGSVNSGALMLIETPFGPGELVSFRGKVRTESHDSSMADTIERQVTCGFQWMSQIGAFRAIGFGHLHQGQVDKPEKKKVQQKDWNWGNASGFDIILEPEEPFCIAGRPSAGNIFESLEEIPGGIIRGCIARKLNRMIGNPKQLDVTCDDPQPSESATLEKTAYLDPLRHNFSKIRISHAFPSAQCLTRPVRPPLSLIKADRMYDVALLETPVLINGRAPVFDIDWKEDHDVKTMFGWPNLQKELRVRTSIDREKLRYRDEALFAYEMIVPKNHCWLARVDVGEIEPTNRVDVMNCLANLLDNGLLGMGKSKASVKVGIQQPGALKDTFATRRVDHRMGVDSLLVLTLQTPALLPDPTTLRMQNDSEVLFLAYRNAWKEIAPALKLRRFFARQFLSGGRYQHGRFQQTESYQPWLLTQAGSVFVFNVGDVEKARSTVQGWLDHGLPIPPSVLKAYDLGTSDDPDQIWKQCPFIRQNGYGEIAVNLKVHEENCPPADQCKPICRLADEEVNRD